jgi:hypothetical protein
VFEALRLSYHGNILSFEGIGGFFLTVVPINR